MTKPLKIHYENKPGFKLPCGRLSGMVTKDLSEVTCSSCREAVKKIERDKRTIPNKPQIPF